jgi:hypothetical protein
VLLNGRLSILLHQHKATDLRCLRPFPWVPDVTETAPVKAFLKKKQNSLFKKHFAPK